MCKQKNSFHSSFLQGRKKHIVKNSAMIPVSLFVYISPAICLHYILKKRVGNSNFSPLTSFIFRVWHKCLLHGFWCQNFVFFLNSGRCGGSYFLLGHNFESFNYGNIAESLGNWQSSLTILELKKKFPWNYNVFCRNFLSILTGLSLFWICNSTILLMIMLSGLEK